jgi:hypothetical protein
VYGFYSCPLVQSKKETGFCVNFYLLEIKYSNDYFLKGLLFKENVV